jgi:hypothetical protein
MVGGGLVLCISLGLSGCGDGANTGKQAGVKPIEMLSTDGVGPINAQTPFNLHDITTAFPNLSVEQRQMYAEGEAYPVIEVSKDAKPLIVVNSDAKREKVYSVMVKSNLIGNKLGHSIGMTFADVYAYGQTEECAPGAEELSGKVLCYAPKTGNILYLFSGIWNGPDGQVPPKDVLAGWKLEGMVWKPPVTK